MFKGSFTALVTPFLPDGGVDEKAFRALVEWQIAEGADGLVPVGTTGESPTLTHEEHRRVVEICIGTAAGRVPVIAGAGSNNTAEAVELCRHAEGARSSSRTVWRRERPATGPRIEAGRRRCGIRFFAPDPG